MDQQERTERIGRQIRAARKAKDLSQAELAAMVAVDVGYISRWERGQHRPSQANLERLARALEVPVAFFYANG